MTSNTDLDTGEAPIGGAVVERVAERGDVDPGRIVDALLALNAELLGRHSAFERSAEYVTVDGTRAYRIDEEGWRDLLADFDFAASTERAVRAVHTEGARLRFASAVGVDDHFAPDEVGVVIGVDTAEQF